MINMEVLVKGCADAKNVGIRKAVGKLLERYGEIYVSSQCNSNDIAEIHSLLELLNASSPGAYMDTHGDMKDAEMIYFHSDSIWKRDVEV
jgi:hypothetical protein